MNKPRSLIPYIRRSVNERSLKKSFVSIGKALYQSTVALITLISTDNAYGFTKTPYYLPTVFGVAIPTLVVYVWGKRKGKTWWTGFRRMIYQASGWILGVIGYVLLGPAENVLGLFRPELSIDTAQVVLAVFLLLLVPATVFNLADQFKITETPAIKSSETDSPEIIGRASVRDLSVPVSPSITSGATKREIRGIAIGIAILLIVFGALTGVLGFYFKSTTVDQVNTSMPLVVQLDSFLTGGWVVGFFYYWSSWERALRASKNARRRLRGHPKDPIQFKNAELAKLWHQMLAREKELSPTQGLFVMLILGVMMFIISGIVAVFAILTYTLLTVQLAIEFMVGGVLVMGFSWVVLRYITQRLREAIDVALDWAEPEVRFP